MKIKRYNRLIFIWFISMMVFSKATLAQCVVQHDNIAGSIGLGNQPTSLAQGFIAECDGQLEFVQLFASSASAGPIDAGTLNIYQGNTASGTPIYSQSYPSITTNIVDDPIRVDITGALDLTMGNQYTFELTSVNNVGIRYDSNMTYSGGSAFLLNIESTSFDFVFLVSIVESNLSTVEFEKSKDITIRPSLSSEAIIVNGLTHLKKYEIFNSTGTKVLKGRIAPNRTIIIKDLTPGMYVLKLDNTPALKFIKR